MRYLFKWAALLLVGIPMLTAETKESLLIGPGDLLHVQVFDTPELEQRARVTDSGDLPLIMGGNVRIAGLTPVQAASVIQDALLDGHLLLHPRVLITVQEYATEKVSIVGEVRVPGAYSIETPRSILDVLTMAGGLSDLASRQILVQRRGTLEKIPYFISNSPEVALDSAVQVNPGDTVVVPKAGIVYALGDVSRPGGYTITTNDGKLSALELLSRAGGASHTAVPSHTILIRKSGSGGFTEMPLQLGKMEKGQQPDIQLQPDDIIYVPFSYIKNFAVSGSGIAASAASAAVYKF